MIYAFLGSLILWILTFVCFLKWCREITNKYTQAKYELYKMKNHNSELQQLIYDLKECEKQPMYYTQKIRTQGGEE